MAKINPANNNVHYDVTTKMWWKGKWRAVELALNENAEQKRRERLRKEDKSNKPRRFGDFVYDPITDTSYGEIGIVSYKGSAAAVTVPAEIDGKKVGFIADGCFKNCEAIEEIILPEGLRQIGDEAFGNCSGLRKINIPDSISKLGEDIFRGCNKLKDIKLPENENILWPVIGITADGSFLYRIENKYIGGAVIMSCLNKEIEKAEVPEKIKGCEVKAIESEAFGDCKKLRGISLPCHLNELGHALFRGSHCPVNITLPMEMRHVETDTFSDGSQYSAISIELTPEEVFDILQIREKRLIDEEEEEETQRFMEEMQNEENTAEN